jgi:hypothetical protein
VGFEHRIFKSYKKLTHLFKISIIYSAANSDGIGAQIVRMIAGTGFWIILDHSGSFWIILDHS